VQRATVAKATDSELLQMNYGCGDGGFVHNIKKLELFNNIEFMGIDFDNNAMNWAKQFRNQKTLFVEMLLTYHHQNTIAVH